MIESLPSNMQSTRAEDLVGGSQSAQVISKSRKDGRCGNKRKLIAPLLLLALLIFIVLIGAGAFSGSGDDNSSSISPPTEGPTKISTSRPTKIPTSSPTKIPTSSPTKIPTSSPTKIPTASPTVTRQLLFPAEIRDGSDHIGLFLLNEMEDEAFTAFRAAASRWSAIIDGTVVSPGTIPASSSICGLFFEEETLIDHLIIATEVAPIDGVGLVLGQAGPCGIIDLPLLGLMSFDSADIAELISEGAIKSVILHEMGHVLGIGSLWRRFNLFEDPILNEDGSLNNARNQPKMTGGNATEQYRLVTRDNTETFVPVEDGTTNGVDIFVPKTKGAGSVDSHWDEEYLPRELMDYSIDPSGPAPPLSAVTLASLKDFGYAVNMSLADAYSLSAAKTQKLRGNSAKEYIMVNDILNLKPVFLNPVEY